MKVHVHILLSHYEVHTRKIAKWLIVLSIPDSGVYILAKK